MTIESFIQVITRPGIIAFSRFTEKDVRVGFHLSDFWSTLSGRVRSKRTDPSTPSRVLYRTEPRPDFTVKKIRGISIQIQ